jgi:hypothetical protein
MGIEKIHIYMEAIKNNQIKDKYMVKATPPPPLQHPD